MADVTLTISTESAKAIQDMVRFAEAQDKVSKSANSAGKTLEKSSRGADMLSAGLGKVISVGAGLAALKAAVGELDEYMQQLGKHTSETHANFSNFIGLQGPNMGEKNTQLAQLMGAKHGVDAKIAIDTVSQFQSAAGGDFWEGMRGAEQSFKLQRVDSNLTGEQAKNILRIGQAQGLDPDDAADITLTAADLSNLSLGEYAKAGVGAAAFKDAVTGAAVVTALSAGAFRSPEEMATGAKQLAVGINTENEFTKRMAKQAKAQGRDWETMDEQARLGFVDQSVVDKSQGGFQKAGLGSVESAFALQEFYKQQGTFATAVDRLTNRPDGVVDARINKILESPRQRALDAKRTTEEMADFASDWSQESKTAQRMDLKREQRGATLREYGMGVLTNDEGKPRLGINAAVALYEWGRTVTTRDGEEVPQSRAVRTRGGWERIESNDGSVADAGKTIELIGELNRNLGANTDSNRELVNSNRELAKARERREQDEPRRPRYNALNTD